MTELIEKMRGLQLDERSVLVITYDPNKISNPQDIQRWMSNVYTVLKNMGINCGVVAVSNDIDISYVPEHAMIERFGYVHMSRIMDVFGAHAPEKLGLAADVVDKVTSLYKTKPEAPPQQPHEVKYVVYGAVDPANGQYITPQQVATLYGVPAEECMMVERGQPDPTLVTPDPERFKYTLRLRHRIQGDYHSHLEEMKRVRDEVRKEHQQSGTASP